MSSLTRHIRLEQPVMMRPIFAQLRRGVAFDVDPRTVFRHLEKERGKADSA